MAGPIPASGVRRAVCRGAVRRGGPNPVPGDPMIPPPPGDRVLAHPRALGVCLLVPRGEGRGRSGGPPVAHPRAWGSPPSRPDGLTSSSVYPRARGLDVRPRQCSCAIAGRPIPVPSGPTITAGRAPWSTMAYPRARGSDSMAKATSNSSPDLSPHPGVRHTNLLQPDHVYRPIPAPGGSARDVGGEDNAGTAYPRARGLGGSRSGPPAWPERPILAPGGSAAAPGSRASPAAAYPRARGLDSKQACCQSKRSGLSPRSGA